MGLRRGGEIWCHVTCWPLAWWGDGIRSVRTDSDGVEDHAKIMQGMFEKIASSIKILV